MIYTSKMKATGTIKVTNIKYHYNSTVEFRYDQIIKETICKNKTFKLENQHKVMQKFENGRIRMVMQLLIFFVNHNMYGESNVILGYTNICLKIIVNKS